ncbi:hypothetical protein ACFLU4_04435 [Chloroflexota bacterium]
MIEKVEHDGIVYAMIIRHDYIPKEMEFFTPGETPLQMGIILHKKGYQEKPHVHKIIKRPANRTQEVVHISSGRVSFRFFTNDCEEFATTILEKGDTIILLNGGHSIKVLDDFWGLIVKQGPYTSIGDDKQLLEVEE